MLTYKGRAVDEVTGSKPEVEVEVADYGLADEIFVALGFCHLVSFEQRCMNYSSAPRGVTSPRRW